MSALTLDFVRACAADVGVTEHPPGSNRGPQIDAYLRSCGLEPGQPWCAAFLHFHKKAVCAAANVVPGIRIGASVPDLLRRAKEANRLIGPSDVRPSTLWIWTPKNHPQGAHVEVCTSTVVNGLVSTIGGNTSDGHGVDPNGGGVYVRERDAAHSCVFVNVF